MFGDSTPLYKTKRNTNIYLHKDFYMRVHSNIIHNNLKLKQPKCPSIDEQVNKM